MDYDYDETFRKAMEEGLERALEGLTPEQAAALEDSADDLLSRVVSETIEDSAKGLVGDLKRDAPGMLEHRRNWQADFERRLAEHWGPAFDLAEMVMKVASEVGEFFYEKHVPPDGRRDFVFEALSRLLARACRIAEEVLVLLKAGYGQAGLARWRALDEVAIVADFIAENGEDCAERYFAHEAVETWRGMQEFQQHAERLRETPYSEEEMEAAKGHFDALIERYGARFGGPYGWAQAALAAKDSRYSKRDATLPAIELSVGTQHMRPHYRMASHGIHANPKGVTWTPDLLAADHGAVLLTGPSPAGLADPGHAALISLTRVTAAALASKGGEATGLIILALLQLTDEAGEAYLQAHCELEAGERERQAPATGSSTSDAGSPH
ncbi:MAG: DUF5677 domain-containing protein [Solirubrobacteraceae bacterium]